MYMQPGSTAAQFAHAFQISTNGQGQAYIMCANKDVDAIYIRSLFSASNRALIGSQPSQRCATGRLTRVAGDRRCPAAESSVAVQMIVCPSVPMCYVTWQRRPHKQPAASFLVRHICSSRIQRFHAGAKSRPAPKTPMPRPRHASHV